MHLPGPAFYVSEQYDVEAGTGVCPDTKISLGDVIGRFKCLTSRKYIAGIRKHGWPPFAGRLWQRNYYEHIIRNDHDLSEIREYIFANPSKWSGDHEYVP